jgi:hypothetical protein
VESEHGGQQRVEPLDGNPNGVGAHSTEVFGLSVVPMGRVLGGLRVQVTRAAKKVLRLVPIYDSIDFNLVY